MKGFLIRGTLSPSMGSTTGAGRNISSTSAFRRMATNPVNRGKIVVGPSKVQNNRIPPSISIKKNNGVR